MNRSEVGTPNPDHGDSSTTAHRSLGARLLRSRPVAALAISAALSGACTRGTFSDSGYGCPPVSIRQMNSVGKIGLQADNPELTRIVRERDVSDDAFQNDFENYTLEQAKKYGVTVIDRRPYRAQLEKADSVDQVFDVLSKFTANYGIKIKTGERNEKERLHKKDIDLKQFKEGAGAFISTVHFMPVELVKLSGVTTIEIVNSLEKFEALGQKLVPNGIIIPEKHIIRVPIEDFYNGNPKVISHEIAHGVDYFLCGPTGWKMNDPLFTKLNPKGFRYGVEDDDAVDAVVAEVYGETNVLEDKATELQRSLVALDLEILAEDTPLRKKYEVLMARIVQKIPKLDLYLRSISKTAA